MKGLLLLLYSAEILGVLLFIPGCATETGTDAPSSTSQAASTPDTNASTSNMSETSSFMTTELTTTVPQSSNGLQTTTAAATTTTTTATTTTTTTTTTTSYGMFYKRECVPVFMVAGGLIIACTILLISTLMLMWKVCQLSRRLKALNSNSDLISNSEYWMGTAKKNKGKSDTEAKETTVLMSDLSQTQEEMKNGTAKDDGGKVKEDGQMGEEKEAGDTAKSEEASGTPVTENSSSSKPQEEAAANSTKAAPASSSGGAEEPKE